MFEIRNFFVVTKKFLKAKFDCTPFLGYLGTILGTETERQIQSIRNPSLLKEYRVHDGDKTTLMLPKRSKSLPKPQEIEEIRKKNKIAKSKIL